MEQFLYGFLYFAIFLKFRGTSMSKFEEILSFDVPAEHEDNYRQAARSASVRIIDF
jgi:hypothetical protein